MLSISPLHDANFAVEGVRKATPSVQAVYKLLGNENGFEVQYPDCEHDFPPAMRERAYQFLGEALGRR